LISIKLVNENITLPFVSSLTNRLGLIKDGQEREVATEYVRTLDIDTPDIDQEQASPLCRGSWHDNNIG